MKNILTILWLLLGIQVMAQNNSFYYSRESKIEMTLDRSKVTLFLASSYDSTLIRKEIELLIPVATWESIRESIFKSHENKLAEKENMVIVHFEEIPTLENYNYLLSLLSKVSKVLAVQQNYLTLYSQKPIATTRRIMAEVRSEASLDEAIKTAKRYGLLYQGEAIVGTNWLEFSMTSSENAFELANRIYESEKIFLQCVPNIYTTFEQNCVNPPNDGFFNQQWYLNNTGQGGGTPGVDIKYCEAMSLNSPKGLGVTVALVDDGVEMTHPDLAANIASLSFDAVSNTSPSRFRNRGRHATPCAGIIAAVTNNNQIGVSGVAPSAKIMSISTELSGSDQEYSRAINFAYKYDKAQVISNSWASGNLPMTLTEINDALNDGRGGLGAVVVFGSGNDNQANGEEPGNQDPRILYVGGVDRCGVRSGNTGAIPQTCEDWGNVGGLGSSFGAALDVVAGGTNIITTDRTGTTTNTSGFNPSFSNPQNDLPDRNYTRFGGTSAACPQAAGVAALILSVNPCLTNVQVNDIIERSAQKVPGRILDTGTPNERPLYEYNYNSSIRPNGKWNNQLGYGMIDAFDALRLTQTLYVQKRDFAPFSVQPQPTILLVNPIGEVHAGREVDITGSFEEGDVEIQYGADVKFKSFQRIRIRKGFHAKAGCSFRAFIDPSVVGCNGWTSTKRQDTQTRTSDLEAEQPPLTTIRSDDKKISLYPNPNNGQFTLEYKPMNPEKTESLLVQVFNSIGQMVLERQYDGQTNNNALMFQIDSPNLAPGLYFLQFREGNLLSNLKFVVHEN